MNDLNQGRTYALAYREIILEHRNLLNQAEIVRHAPASKEGKKARKEIRAIGNRLVDIDGQDALLGAIYALYPDQPERDAEVRVIIFEEWTAGGIIERAKRDRPSVLTQIMSPPRVSRPHH